MHILWLTDHEDDAERIAKQGFPLRCAGPEAVSLMKQINWWNASYRPQSVLKPTGREQLARGRALHDSALAETTRAVLMRWIGSVPVSSH